MNIITVQGRITSDPRVIQNLSLIDFVYFVLEYEENNAYWNRSNTERFLIKVDPKKFDSLIHIIKKGQKIEVVGKLDFDLGIIRYDEKGRIIEIHAHEIREIKKYRSKN